MVQSFALHCAGRIHSYALPVAPYQNFFEIKDDADISLSDNDPNAKYFDFLSSIGTERRVLELESFKPFQRFLKLLIQFNCKQNQVAFAIKYKKQNWNKVIFSDKAMFQMFEILEKLFTRPPIRS